MRNFFLFLFFISISSANAQIEDSVYTALRKRPKFTINLDSRNSFVSDRKTTVYGLLVGLDFAKTLHIGIGYHWLGTGNYRNFYPIDSMGVRDTVRADLKLHYFAYYAEQVFYHKKRWEFAALFRFGLGSTQYHYTFEGKEYAVFKRMVILYEPAITGSFKIFRWLGVGGDAGLRLMLKNNKLIPENLNSPIYALHLDIYFSQLYRMVFPKKKE